MELWPVFGGRSEYEKAPRAVVQRCRHIFAAKRRAEHDEQKEADKR